MEKIELGTPDGTVENVERLAELFPQVVTEVQGEDGDIERAVDFDALRDLLGDVAEEGRERYQFTWPGKREAKAEARRPIFKTMIPELEKSKGWDTTENLYIEGDNLEALKLLKETYAGKVKLIYIDPPYNTGHDFVYDDDFAKSRGEYDAENGDFDEEGGRLVANTEGNGRFHSDWCSMMYPRLLLARDLLSADGMIFISIDDGEQENLKKICGEVFGSSNFIANLIWEKKYTRANDAVFFSSNHDFILCYAKDVLKAQVARLPRTEEMNKAYKNPDNDIRGPWKSTPLHARSGSSSAVFEFTFNNGAKWTPPSGTYSRYSKEKLAELDQAGELWFGKDGKAVPSRKTYLSKVEGNGIVPCTIIPHELGGHNHMAVEEVKGLFGGENVFSSPKPVKLLRLLLDLSKVGAEDIVLDFFSGSASMAEAVIAKNAEDGGRRKFVLVQIPEETSGQFSTLTEIGEERIRRAGEKIRAEIDEANQQLEIGAAPKPYPDFGFRVLRIDSSNMKDSYLRPGETVQASLFDQVDNVKEGRTDLDLLFEVLPKFRIPYSAKIEERVLAGKRVFFVDGDRLAACFDAGVGTETIEEMAKAKPWIAVMRDASMVDDATQANFAELFRTYSPDTHTAVI